MVESNLRLEDENGPIERELLLRGIQLKYGYDFTHYAENTMRRRIETITRQMKLRSTIDLLNLVIHNRRVFEDVLPQLTIGVTEFFRDPEFFRSLREKVVPLLKTFPRLTIWCAGVSTGEEVFSLAILLKEEGLLERSTIFATDINARSLRSAREGIYSAEHLKEDTRNYTRAGGTRSFNDYYTADYGLIKMDSGLLKNVVFSDHNLATDAVFAECQLILCRNTLMYFDVDLQNRVLELFLGSLRARGFLALGARENITTSDYKDDFEIVDRRWKIFQRAIGERRIGYA